MKDNVFFDFSVNKKTKVSLFTLCFISVRADALGAN